MNKSLFERIGNIHGVSDLKCQGHSRSYVISEALPFVLSYLYKFSDSPMVYVSSSSDQARLLKHQLDTFIGPENVIIIPEPDQPYQHIVPDPQALGQHIAALTAVITHKRPFVIMSYETLVTKLPEYDIVKKYIFQLARGSVIKQLDLSRKLEKMGYIPCYPVEMPVSLQKEERYTISIL